MCVLVAYCFLFPYIVLVLLLLLLLSSCIIFLFNSTHWPFARRMDPPTTLHYCYSCSSQLRLPPRISFRLEFPCLPGHVAMPDCLVVVLDGPPQYGNWPLCNYHWEKHKNVSVGRIFNQNNKYTNNNKRTIQQIRKFGSHTEPRFCRRTLVFGRHGIHIVQRIPIIRQFNLGRIGRIVLSHRQRLRQRVQIGCEPINGQTGRHLQTKESNH
jgi:hypothetical protein